MPFCAFTKPSSVLRVYLFSSLQLFFLLVSCVRVQTAAAQIDLSATGFDSHAELKWTKPAGVASFNILRSTDGGANFSFLQKTNSPSALDFTGHTPGVSNTFFYKIEGLNAISQVVSTSNTASALVAALPDSMLLDMVQRYTFRYFWEFAHPASGMARERNSSGNTVTTGGTGFGVMAILVGVHRGFITREEGRDRLLKIVGFLGFADRFHGVFPHWMDGNTGDVIPFSQFDNGGDLVETAFLIQGLLAARQYFDDPNDPIEGAIRSSITDIWEDVEWDWYRKNNSGVLYWHWSPNFGWQMNFQLRGWNEAMIVYILAAASPTHGVPASLWTTGWTAQNYYSGLTWYGHKLFVGEQKGGPLFFAHYSFLGFDPRGKKDYFCNYFLQNRNHSLVNRAYCIENPKNYAGYSGDSWGLTASDVPSGYRANKPNDNDGTIAPTAALSSMPYTPDESMAALKNFYRVRGAKLWGDMGFFDAFNDNQNWVASSYLAIDQGPIIDMIENHRSGLLWSLFMSNPEISPALTALGFVPDNSVGATQLSDNQVVGFKISPNPISDGRAKVDFDFLTKKRERLDLIDEKGRLVQSFFIEKNQTSVELELKGIPDGLYFLKKENGATATVVVQK